MFVLVFGLTLLLGFCIIYFCPLGAILRRIGDKCAMRAIACISRYYDWRAFVHDREAARLVGDHEWPENARVEWAFALDLIEKSIDITSLYNYLIKRGEFSPQRIVCYAPSTTKIIAKLAAPYCGIIINFIIDGHTYAIVEGNIYSIWNVLLSCERHFR